MKRQQTRVDVLTERGTEAGSTTNSEFRSSNAAGQDSDTDRRKRAKWGREKTTKELQDVLKMSGSRVGCMADVSVESREKGEVCLKLQ
ncbi:hypothetical protein NEUTE2DRAFT_133455 [Neurospora tetrasperma FGSC 2509]|nr:hypothetical protein NEUTE2DRAFT_133455 [Neurospora tetrasperma FGSC 2509]